MKPRVITAVAIAIGVLGAATERAPAAPPAAEGPVIHNVAAEVFRYWDGAKNLSPEGKYKAWVEAIEGRHRDFYENVIYGGMGGRVDEAARRAMVDRFLAALPEGIEGQRAVAVSMDRESDGLLAGRNSLTMDVYRKYFADPNGDPFVPQKSAYYIGYLIVKDLEKETALDEMLQWDLDTLDARMVSGLTALKATPPVEP